MAFGWHVDNYRQVFRHRSFRNFWIGFALSIAGDALTRVALTWYVWETTQSSRALGLLTFFYTVPVILGGLLAGSLLDRFDRGRVMMVDSVIRGVVVLSIPLLHAAGRLEIWHIYVVAGLYGGLMMISLAGAPALIPSLVSEEHLSTANALETLAYTLSGVVGPPLAGILVARLGAPMVVTVDAFTYFVFAFALSRVRLQPEETSESTGAGGTYRLGDAFRLLLQNKILRSTTLMFMFANLGLGMLFVWLPIYSDQILGGGAALYGILLGFLAAGEVVSSIAAGSLALRLSLGTLICLAQFLSGLTLGTLLLGRTIWTAAITLTLFGLFSAPLTIWAQTLRMQIIPAPLRGRTFALLRMLMQSANPIGGIYAGWALPLLGIPVMIGLSSAVIGLPGLLGSRVRELRLESA